MRQLPSGGKHTPALLDPDGAFFDFGPAPEDSLDELTAAGVYEEAKHPRDNKGKFAKKPGGAGKSLKITHMLVHKNHGEPGTVLTENGAGDKRVVWDGKEYRLQSKTGDDKWTTDKKVKKSKAYVEINAYDSDWREPKSADASDDNEVKDSTKKPLAPATPTPTPDIAEVTPADEGPTTGLGPPLKSMSDLTKIKPHKKGGIFNDTQNVLWNVQPASSESHARNQFLAANLYNFAGVSVEHTDLVEIDPEKIPGGSGVGVKTVHAPTTAGIVDTMTTSASARKQVNENFAIDAWLGNWDVVGLGYENLSVDKYGEVKRTNIGGSLLYRANGQPKGAAFSDEVTEIDSLRNPHVNPSSAKVFADVTDDDIRAGVAKLENLSPNIIDFVVEQSGFTGAEATKLKNTLKARRQDLINKYGSNAPKPSVPDVPATSSQPTVSNALGGAKKYTYSQKAKVQSIFAKHGVKWFNKTNAIYDAAHEVSTTHPDLTMADALDIMDQSLKKKTGNPFRTKTEKWLKTKAGKQHALAKGSSASLGGTSPATPATPSPTQPAAPVNGQFGKYQKMNRAATSAMQTKMNNETPPPWTTEQRDALRTYTGGSYTTINKCARGTAPCDEHTKKLLDNINAGMKPSTKDIMVFRKTNPKSFGLESAADVEALVGKIINDDGVISTSIRSDMWSGALDLEIEAPKGSMMAWVQPISLHPSEDEIVVAPGTHYEVISIEKSKYGHGYKVRLRIIPGSDARSADIAAKKAQEEKEKAEKDQAKKVSKQGINALLTAYNEGYVVEKEFTAGNSSSKTELLRLANGTRVVRKTGGKQILSGKPDTRFEYLSGQVWNALGDTSIHTAQVSDDTVITTYVEGDMGGKLLNNTFKSGNTNQENKKAHKEETLRQIQLPGGKEIGLLDYLIANQDRHSLNWIVGPNNDQVHPIDQGGAVFIPSTHMENGVSHPAYVASEFSDYWLGIKASWYVKSMKPKFTKAELAQYRTNLESIKDEFAEGEETEWYNSMMSRLAQVESKVKV